MHATVFPFRSFAWLAFFGLILGAWWIMYAMAMDMGMTLTGGMSMPVAGEMQSPMGEDKAMPAPDGMDMPAAAAPMMDAMSMDGMPMMQGMTSLGVLIPMWMIMMAAMMGPTFVPTARTYEDLIGTGVGTRAGFLGLISGYLGVWFGFGAAIALAHAAFLRLDLLNAMGASQSILFSALLLAAAGIFQFTATKDRCLEYCRSPMIHFMARWRNGFGGGAWMGGRIGLYCIACCWAIMSLGFVGGAMNLLWMGIATLIMTLEKLPDIGRWMTRPLGAAFLGAALWHITKLL